MTCRSSTPSSTLLTRGFSGRPLHIGKCTRSLFCAPGSPLVQRYRSTTSALLSFVVHIFRCRFSPTGGASFRRRASSRALSADRHVYTEAHTGDNQPLPASPSRLDIVLHAFPSAARAVQASPLPQGLQILPSGRHTNSHTLGLHHRPEKAV